MAAQSGMTAQPEVAIVGGGITGTVAATTLARLLPGARITLFDQGRGLGGRASHRRVDDGKVVAPWARSSMAFDHGCQFFQGGDAEFREKILNSWLKAGLAAEWRGRFAGAGDFFGVGRETVYVGVGGMHTVTAGAAQQLECNHSNFVARRGVRVGAFARAGDRWALSGVGGEAAIHDSKLKSSDVEEARAAAALGEFDAVIVTDASAAQESWHRASAGLPEAFLAMSKRVRDRVRVAMFTAIVAFEARVPVAFDASSFQDSTLWFAARTNSKPGFEALEKECWTLVSTPAWAAAEVERVPMRDPATGAFIPQSPEVLEAPARALLDAFAAEVGAPLPAHTYLHAQRWGSAFPAPLTHGRDADGRSDATKDVLGTAFDASSTEQFAGLGGGGAGGEDFVDGGDLLGLYYAGDFCSPRPPGVVAAALSGKHAAEACARRLV